MNMQPDEHDDYLWDKSGEADAEVARLERLLARYRYDAARDKGFDAQRALSRTRPSWRAWGAALAAAVALFFGVRSLWNRPDRPGYDVRGIPGLARAYVGDSIETSASQTAIVRVATLGDVKMQPGSRVRVEDIGEKAHKLFLDRGAISATIVATPGQFQIDTPAGLSIDLGCKYDLRIDEQGATHMRVLTGRVKFTAMGKTVVVPKNAECEARPGVGPNVPVRIDAPAEFREAARRLELAPEPDPNSKFVELPGDPKDVQLVLEDSNAHDDSVTLFHLFTNASSQMISDAALNRLKIACPLPEGITPEKLRERDERAIEAWRNSIANKYW